MIKNIFLKKSNLFIFIYFVILFLNINTGGVKAVDYSKLTIEECRKKLESINNELMIKKSENLNYDITRGKPSRNQIDLTRNLHNFKITDWLDEGQDIANYGGSILGLDKACKLMAPLVGLFPNEVFVLENQSLALMHDIVSFFRVKGINGNRWNEGDKMIVFVPGYDRHFKIIQFFGLEIIPLKLSKSGPDMNEVRNIIKDKSVVGMWCVTPYSNPEGITYSDDVLMQLAKLEPASEVFRIILDNAYCVHHFKGKMKSINVFDLIRNTKFQDLIIAVGSTSKIATPSSGLGVIGCLGRNFEALKEYYETRFISPNKIMQTKYVNFFGETPIEIIMEEHAKILAPKFECVIKSLSDYFTTPGYISWTDPSGGYFISVEILKGSARDVVKYCNEVGLKVTPSGATHPYGIDPEDKYIRVAPTSLDIETLKKAMEIFILCVEKSILENQIKNFNLKKEN